MCKLGKEWYIQNSVQQKANVKVFVKSKITSIISLEQVQM